MLPQLRTREIAAKERKERKITNLFWFNYSGLRSLD